MNFKSLQQLKSLLNYLILLFIGIVVISCAKLIISNCVGISPNATQEVSVNGLPVKIHDVNQIIFQEKKEDIVVTSAPTEKMETAAPTPTPILIPKFSHKVVAYIGGWKNLENSKIEFSQFNFLNYAFLGVNKDLQVFSFQPLDEKNFNYLSNVKKTFPHLNILISLGGWVNNQKGCSFNFKDEFRLAKANDENSRKFAQNCLEFLKKYDFDGITLDWEFPEGQDKSNFHVLLKALREAFDAEKLITKKQYYISVDAGGFACSYMDMAKSSIYADWINIMVYNMESKQERKHKANLFAYNAQPFGSSGESCDTYIKQFICNGCPAEKMSFGVSFHGNSNITGNGAPIYWDIVNHYLNKNGYQRYWDEQGKMPILVNGQNFISYDDPQSLIQKCNYIKNNNMAGMVYWEYFCDGTGELVKTVCKNLSK